MTVHDCSICGESTHEDNYLYCLKEIHCICDDHYITITDKKLTENLDNKNYPLPRNDMFVNLSDGEHRVYNCELCKKEADERKWRMQRVHKINEIMESLKTIIKTEKGLKMLDELRKWI